MLTPSTTFLSIMLQYSISRGNRDQIITSHFLHSKVHLVATLVATISNWHNALRYLRNRKRNCQIRPDQRSTTRAIGCKKATQVARRASWALRSARFSHKALSFGSNDDLNGFSAVARLGTSRLRMSSQQRQHAT
jgi:hypothetical protein